MPSSGSSARIAVEDRELRLEHGELAGPARVALAHLVGCAMGASCCARRRRRSAGAGSAPRRRSARPRACDASTAPPASALTAMIARSSSTPHIVCWKNSRVPTASTTSASPHSSCPSGSVTASGLRASSTPWPRRKPHSTGACSISASSVTSGEASCAPPPTTISGFFAAPRRLAASRSASSSIAGCIRRQRRDRRRLARLAPHVDGAFERGRAGPSRRHRAERLRHHARRRRRIGHQRRMIDQARQDAGLVVDLVQVAEFAADVAVRDLPDQRQHLRVHRIGGEQRGRRIEQARAGHHRVGLRLAGGERGAERHVGGALFVPRMHGADHVGRLEQRVEQMVVLHAGQRVERVEAMRDQRRDDRLGGGHLRHGLPLLPNARSLADRRIGVECGPARFALTNKALHAPFARFFRHRGSTPCIAIVPTPAALCATATSARPCGFPAGCIACAITAACCSSTCATITASRRWWPIRIRPRSRAPRRCTPNG